MFNWDDLRSFIEVTRTKSLSRAANRLGVNHTTVARRIQALEESLGAQLFDKTPSGYMLTDTGRQLLTLAEKVEATCISAQEILAAKNAELTGIVRLSVPEGFGCHFLMKYLGDFYKQYPAIELEIMARRESLSISKREVDIGITFTQPSIGRLVTRELTRFTLRLYAARTYLERSPPVLCLEDLRRHRLIGNIDDPVYTLYPDDDFNHDCLNEVVANTHIGLRVKSSNAQLAAIEAGLGISLLPCYMTAYRDDLAAVLPDEATLACSSWIAMHEDMRHVHRVTAVWNWLKMLVTANQPALLGSWMDESQVSNIAPWQAA